MTSVLRAMARLRGSSDVALAALALMVLSLLVAPIPPWLLDLCIAANLALAAAVLVVALFARDALRFASFPTLLLFTTLLRLALEVSATRLVLARGEAGQVIQAFGQVVVAGNYVVGAVVFAILTLVQLLVVSKGAERVAEVAARFTLDAMPGKQMSIDADLRAGAIDQDEARRRRRSLEREGHLYGAMDGALKFVKGDAIAGVAIVLVNVAGGLVAGLVRGLPLGQAARRYALLAIGDGLVAQIPALLISVAAGVVVTRVAAEEEGASLSQDLFQQLFADPRVLGAVAVLCGGLAILPGLPAGPFALLSAAAAAAAHLVARRRRSSPCAVERAHDRMAPSDHTHMGQLTMPVPLELELAPDLSDLARADGGLFARELLPAIRHEISTHLGVFVPEITARAAPLPPGSWRLLLDGVPAAAGRAPASEAVVLTPPLDLVAVGIEVSADVEPLSGLPVARIASADASRAEVLAPVRGPLERVGAGVAAALRTHAHLLVGVQEAQALLDALEPSHPVLVREVTRLTSTPILAEVLRQLLEEGISIRPLRNILDALLEAGGGGRAPTALAEACRRALRRHIAFDHAGSGTLDVLLLDPAAEAALRDALGGGSNAAVEPGAARALLEDIERELASREAVRPPVLLTSAELRRALRQLVAQRFPRLAVLSYEELPPDQPVRPVGKVAFCDPAAGELSAMS
jgi:type III secretion protein V